MIENQLAGVELHLPKVPELVIQVTKVQNDDTDCSEDYNWKSEQLPFSKTDIKYMPIVGARCMTRGEDVNNVFELSLESQDSVEDFRAGDTIAILPCNSDTKVKNLFKILDIANDFVKISHKRQSGQLPKHLPPCGSLYSIFSKYVDLECIPKKIFICHLSECTTDPVEKRCLQEICSREGADLYNSEILNKNMTFLNLLKDYPSCKPSVELLLQHLPRLLPRPYSVCNSPLNNLHTIKICFTVVTRPNGETGLTTGWLKDQLSLTKFLNKAETTSIESISDGLKNLNLDIVKIPVYIRKAGCFRLPLDQSKPLIMIGVGTGIAPFVGFLEERRYLQILTGNQCGPATLYFGCRYNDRDYLYQEELNGFLKDEVLNRLRVSFSREGNKIKYVQDYLLEEAEEIVSSIDEGAIIYLCGDLNKIAQQITQTLNKCLSSIKSCTEAEAEAILNDMKNSGRLLQDIWY